MLENRQLAAHEQAMEILNNLAATYNVVTIGRIKGILNQKFLRQALDVIQSRHPSLSSRIIAKSNSFWLEGGADKIPLLVVKKQQIQQWEEVVIQELNQKINSDRNLLRVTLIEFEEEENICYLIATIHHAIADASSCIQLHSEILTNCQKIAEGNGETSVKQLPQLPSTNTLIPKSIKDFARIGNIFFLLRIKLQLIRYKPTTLNFEKSVPLESRSCGMVHRKLDSQLTARLLDVCRQQKTTIQAALAAAMLFAVAEKTNLSQRKNTYLSFQSAVNLRPRLKPKISNEHLSLVASFINTFHNVSLRENKTFWDLARDIKQKLETDLASGDAFRFIFASKTLLKFMLKNPDKSPISASLTNIGRVNIPHNYGQIELEEISFGSAQSAFGGIFAAAVSTFRGKMLLNFMFSQPSISTETIESLASDMICIISDICNQE
ncbi:MAG: condensation domain-containing protein [Rivularia sp. (in: cyanobacteria)]